MQLILTEYAACKHMQSFSALKNLIQLCKHQNFTFENDINLLNDLLSELSGINNHNFFKYNTPQRLIGVEQNFQSNFKNYLHHRRKTITVELLHVYVWEH